MDLIRPQEASRKLIENAQAISEMTDKIIEFRTDVAVAEAVLMDAKAKIFFNNSDLSATAVQNFITMNTTLEKKALIQAECKLKNFQDLLNVLITSNNNYKMAIKLMDTEIKNLNLQ